MKRLLIAGLAAVAVVNSAWAADSCKKVDNITDADTAACVVRVDGRVVLNEKHCAVTNSRAGRDWSAGAYETFVEIGPLDDPQHPNSRARLNEALWNKGTDEIITTASAPWKPTSTISNSRAIITAGSTCGYRTSCSVTAFILGKIH
jgi:hypothetical protein